MKNFMCVYFLLSLSLMTSCSFIDLRNAQQTLQGTWQVVEIYSTFNGSGIYEFNPSGTFKFSDSSVVYTFTRLNKKHTGSSKWQLSRDKVHAGFINVERYTLRLEKQIYKVEFGDQTSDAEHKANKIRLIAQGGEPETEHTIQLIKLIKQ